MSRASWVRRMVAMVARPRMTLAAIIAIFASAALVWQATQAAFTATTNNSGNTVASGTVVLADNDADGALFTMSNAKPGDSQTQCINVAYTGTLGAQVRMRAAGVGTLAPYLTLTVTRGTFSSVPSSGLCTGFTADSTAYTGGAAGVIYTGLLSALPTTWAAGLVDPSTTTHPTPEVWTTGEAHAYRLQVTVNDDNNAQGKTSAPTFTWEARDASAAGSYYAQAVLADNPASFWRLNETVGTTAVDAKGAAQGTYTGSVTLNTPGPLEDGASAASFDSDTDWVNAGNVHLFPGTAPFSAEFWMKPTAIGDWGLIVGTESYGPHNGWKIIHRTDTGRLHFERFNSMGANGTESLSAPPLGRWTHVVATYDGINIKLYLNGAFETSNASDVSIANTPEPLGIGAHVGGWNGYRGSLADVAIYPYALSAAQVQAHYNARN